MRISIDKTGEKKKRKDKTREDLRHDIDRIVMRISIDKTGEEKKRKEKTRSKT